MKLFRSLLLLLCATLAVPGMGNAAELSLTPTLCAINDGEDHCAISVSVNFTAEDKSRYCLNIADKGLVRCFSGNPQTQIDIYVTADTDTRFLVTAAESGEEVASATLKVARYRPTRHQRRYGWGLL
ncbi:DUF3019 domain-containing protein [Microbulbifer flavimaris]|uniref:DUF3019 domain-containing protein n=1 Tax=Microbulbifer flavimaris TaxID=1781068 RepID=A0ABX4I0U8_9GAMM|nr:MULTISPECIES: DUF3019 domain-containing protein [Microbulbifer]KUJ83858.1 hypothetical protein AVO43_08535 [Microbulbifer sp. ZGT114]PCO06035.1 DUF3019 domain-containing protein [Microbulbifer flavimaris]